MIIIIISFYISVKDTRTNAITLYMKGADSVMSAMIEYSDWLTEEVMLVLVLYTIILIVSVVIWPGKVYVH